MPFKSDKQRKLMYAVANNPAVAKKTGISKKVADKFIEHKAQGGSMATKMPKEGSAAYKAQERKHVNAMKKAGVDPKIVAEEKREAGLKKGGGVKRYANGGMTGGLGVGSGMPTQAQLNSAARMGVNQQQPVNPAQRSALESTMQDFGRQQAQQPQAQLNSAARMGVNQQQPVNPAQRSALESTMQDFGRQQAQQPQAQQQSQAGPGILGPAPVRNARFTPVANPGAAARQRAANAQVMAASRPRGMAMGGMTSPGGEMSPDDMAQFAESLKKEADTRRSKQSAGMGGSTTVGFKKGGKIDGCAVRGKTKGRFI